MECFDIVDKIIDIAKESERNKISYDEAVQTIKQKTGAYSIFIEESHKTVRELEVKASNQAMQITAKDTEIARLKGQLDNQREEATKIIKEREAEIAVKDKILITQRNQLYAIIDMCNNTKIDKMESIDSPSDKVGHLVRAYNLVRVTKAKYIKTALKQEKAKASKLNAEKLKLHSLLQDERKAGDCVSDKIISISDYRKWLKERRGK